MRKDDELEDTAYLFLEYFDTYIDMYNNANLRSIAISLKRIADALQSDNKRLSKLEA